MYPIHIYVILAVFLPLAFWRINRRWVMMSIPAAAICEIAVFWRDFAYYESRGLMILFTAAQALVMAAVILLLMTARRIRRGKKSGRQ